jgi:hypothetical protein
MTDCYTREGQKVKTVLIYLGSFVGNTEKDGGHSQYRPFLISG